MVGDHGRPEASELQRLHQRHRLLWLWALLARTDGRIVGDHDAQESSELQRLQSYAAAVRACGPSRMR